MHDRTGCKQWNASAASAAPSSFNFVCAKTCAEIQSVHFSSVNIGGSLTDLNADRAGA
jgi:hypothetical protein